MNTKPATMAAAGTVLLWASAFPAITVAVRGLGPAGLAVARLAVASAALAVAAPLMGVRRQFGLTAWPQLTLVVRLLNHYEATAR